MIYTQLVPNSNTLYQRYPTKNAGGDHQLALKCNFESGLERGLTRILLSAPDPINYSYDSMSLSLYASNASLYVGAPFSISAYGVTTSWDSGISLDSDYSYMVQHGSNWANSQFGVTWSNSGGDFDSSHSISIVKNYKTIYDEYTFPIDSSITMSNGLLIKFAEQTNTIGTIMFYSSNTNCPLYPRYVYMINDYYWSNSAHTLSSVEDYHVHINYLKTEYDHRDTIKFQLKFAPKKYSRDWTTSYWTDQQIDYCITPNASASYCVYDVTQMSHLKIIDHSPYTRICCDGTVNYFNLDMSQFITNRKYKLELKINNVIYPVKDYFRIV